jgi:hypothetical protein
VNAVNSERRRYFRIDDHVRLWYEPVTDLSHLPGQGADTVTPPRQVLLKDLDAEFNTSLNALWQDYPLAAKALAQLNRKLDLLAANTDGGGIAAGPIASDPVAVNISGCGIAFRVGERLSEGMLLDLRITLLPSETQLRLTARVVGVETIPGSDETDLKPYLLRAEFANSESDAQEVLISHVLQRQQALRTSRDLKSEPEQQPHQG